MLERIEHSSGVVTYQSPQLRAAGVLHAFTTRLGGVSQGPYASLNLGSLAKAVAPDHNTAVAENFRRLRIALGCPRSRRIEVNQVHGCGVWLAPHQAVRPAQAPQADAIVSDEAGALLTVRVADCVPILLSDRTGRCVAAVHAGWRGLVAGVIGQTLDTLQRAYGIAPADVLAAIGPCIGVEAFEVGPEVAQAFQAIGLAQVIDPARSPKPHIDLRQAARLQLHRAGVPPDRIDTTDRCTHRDAHEFFSHRRDQGVTGRLAAVISARA